MLCNVKLVEDPSKELESSDNDLNIRVYVNFLREGGEGKTGVKGAFICVVTKCVGNGGAKMGEGVVGGRLCFAPVKTAW